LTGTRAVSMIDLLTEVRMKTLESFPDAACFVWEDRPLAIIESKVFRVFSDRTLEPAPESWRIADIDLNGVKVSMAEALKRAPKRDAVS